MAGGVDGVFLVGRLDVLRLALTLGKALRWNALDRRRSLFQPAKIVSSCLATASASKSPTRADLADLAADLLLVEPLHIARASACRAVQLFGIGGHIVDMVLGIGVELRAQQQLMRGPADRPSPSSTDCLAIAA